MILQIVYAIFKSSNSLLYIIDGRFCTRGGRTASSFAPHTATLPMRSRLARRLASVAIQGFSGSIRETRPSLSRTLRGFATVADSCWNCEASTASSTNSADFDFFCSSCGVILAPASASYFQLLGV